VTTINELLNQIGVTNDSTEEKTASNSSAPFSEKDMNNVEEELGFKNEKKDFFSTKTASQENGGQKMSSELHTFYNEYFSDDTEKNASEEGYEEGFDKESAAREHQRGLDAHEAYTYLMEDWLNKQAAVEAVLDSEATQVRNKAPSSLTGIPTAQPLLEVDHPVDASKAIDTTPVFTDLEDAAVKKEIIMRKLEEGKPGDISHKTMSVDMGLETPTDQKDA
jgi:hypothetical protein